MTQSEFSMEMELGMLSELSETPLEPEATEHGPGPAAFEELEPAAAPAEDDEPVLLDSEATFGTFHVAGMELALPAERLREVVTLPGHLTRVPLADASVLGIFSLRGELVPVVDAGAILGIERTPEEVAALQEARERRVAIVVSGSSHLGVVFDRTGEVVRVERSSILALAHDDESRGGVLEGMIEVGPSRRLVQVLATEVLGALPGVPRSDLRNEKGIDTRQYAKAIVTQVGDHLIGFPMGSVLEVQEGLTCQRSAYMFEHCQGVVRVRNSVRPVMDFPAVLGLDHRGRSDRHVFLREQETCVAVEIDALVEILEFPEDELMDVPHIPGSRIAELAGGVVADRSGRNVLLIDVQALYERYDLVRAAKSLDQGEADDTPRARAITGDERGYFTFRIGDSTMSLPLDSVLEVCEYPEDVLASGGGGSVVSGIMNLRGEIVPLADIGGILPAEGDPVSVVIVEANGSRRGLVVNSVQDIVRGHVTSISNPAALGVRSENGLLHFVDSAVMVERAAGDKHILVVLNPETFMDLEAEAA